MFTPLAPLAAVIGSAVGTLVNGGTWKSFAIGIGIGIAAGAIAGAMGFSPPDMMAAGFKFTTETIMQGVVAGAVTGAVAGAISSAVYGGNWGNNIGQGAMGGAIGAGVAMTTRAILSSPFMKATYETVKYVVQEASKMVFFGAKTAINWLIGEDFGAGWRAAFSERWVPGPTGGMLPESQAKALSAINQNQVPDNAWKNGMHAWHAGSNAYFVHQYGILGIPLIFAAGLYHESPLDSGSFKAEQYWQGTINHILDSVTDIVANGFGELIGAVIPGGSGIDAAIKYGNHIPGPGDPDPAFGGNGTHQYQGNPINAWGQYP